MIFVDAQVNDGKYAYTNLDGEIEGVLIGNSCVTFQQGSDLESCLNTIWIQDIPKMIKALEAAYKEYTGA